jgi:hypothetical protein
MSCAVILTRSPDRRTLPSRMASTPSFSATVFRSTSLPLKEKDEVRDATVSWGRRQRRFRTSSAMPSLKYSFSGSWLRLSSGSTAIDRISEAARGSAGNAGAPAVSPGAAAGSSGPRSGRISTAQASTSAIGKPTIANTVNSRTLQSGSSSCGKTTETTSTRSHATMA